MKKTSLAIVALAIIIASASTKTYAQKKQGESVVTLGVGSSLTGILFKAIENSVNAVGGASLQVKSTPGLQGMYDFGITDRFSLGVAGSYQSYSMIYAGYIYDTSSVGRNYKDKITRMNIGLRPLVHLGDGEKVDTYLGARFGYTRWSYKTDNIDPNYSLGDIYHSFGNTVKIQVLFGLRYFFTDNIGIGGEISIGSPYFMMGGINAKF
jgi:hypothetical protein